MSGIIQAEAIIAPIADKQLRNHAMIKRIFEEDTFTLSNYVAYLRETYHLVRQTSLYLAAAASNFATDAWFRKWLLNMANEEFGHERLCEHDIDSLGFDSSQILDCLPGRGAWQMISQNHYVAHSDPVFLIGFAMATEGLGAELAGKAAKKLTQVHDIPANATKFLTTHGHEDKEHYRSVQRAFERYAEDERKFEGIIFTWKCTINGYAQLFDDILEDGDDWLEQEGHLATKGNPRRAQL